MISILLKKKLTIIKNLNKTCISPEIMRFKGKKKIKLALNFIRNLNLKNKST